jgi:hypothetical protein
MSDESDMEPGTLPASPISENSPLLAYYPGPVSPLRIGPGKSMPNVSLVV